MKIKRRFLSFFLAVVMMVTALPLTAISVSAAELMDYYPEVDGTGRYTEILNSNGELRFAYAFAKNDIPCNDDFRIEWSDDFYKYYTVVKVLSGEPNPGPETSGKESGSAISEYTHEKSDNYKKSYLDIDQEDLEKYAGKYIKIAIIGYDQDDSYSCRSDTYFYISSPEKEEPDADLDIYPSEIELGENFEYEGTAYGNDYTLNTVTVGFTYYSSEYNYSKKIATDTGYLRYTGLSTDEYYVYKEIQTGSNSYMTCTDETGKITKQFYWGYVGIYTITLYAWSNEYGTDVKITQRVDVVEPAAPKILDITASSSTVRVAEDLVLTVTTNNTVKGIKFFVDSTDNFIGSIENTNGKVTHKFTYRFNKTSNEDINGNDIENKRRIFAYPMDENGEVLLGAGIIYCDITVNPAKYNFDDFDLNSAQTTKDKAVTITWDAVSPKNGSTVYYNLWVDGELVAENLTQNSYILTAAQVNRFGVGYYGTMVMATAYHHRQKQAISGLTIYPSGYVIVYPGDVNGDGTTDGTDVTRLRKYLANTDSTAIPSDGSVSIGADVNEDGKINGKDLTALLNKLKNGNITIPEPEPEPDIPSTLPAVKHTYTVKIPLDKADLKATTGKTIYLMPKYGYVKLVAYDETGKEVKLNQAGITVDISNANGVVTFDGFTLKAVKGGYGVISYTQTVNGKKTTTEIAIHVGEASASSSMWPSSYQYTKEDYEYVSICLDLLYSLNSADVPDYDELEMGLGDEILEGMGDWKDRLSNILQNEWNFETQIIKESIALFIDYYADELESIVKKNNENTKKDADNITDLLEEIYRASDEVDKSIGGVADLIDSISDMRENQVTIEKIAKLQAQVEWMYENGNLKKMFDSSPRLKAYQASKEISLKHLTEKLSNTKKISGRLDIDVVGVGLDFFKGIVYITNDYSNNIKLLEMLKKQIVSEVDANSPEMEAIVELIDEYNNKALTAMDEFLASLVINGFESTILKHPAFAIFDLATLIVNEINHTEEKTTLRNLIFYHTAIGGVVDNASLKMYSEGVFTTTLADIKFASNMYLNLLIFENETALTAVDKKNVAKVNAEIAEIKSMFEHYLNYCILTSV